MATTKKNFIKRAMALRPSAKEWRESVNKAIKAGCLKPFEDMQDNFRDVYPLAAAILQGRLDWYLDGCGCEAIRRQTGREANNIRKFL